MQQIGWLPWIIVGALAGWMANAVVRSRFGLIGDTVVGIGGALMGGLLFNAIGIPRVTAYSGLLFSPIVGSIPTVFSLWSVLVALVGAVTFLAALRTLNASRRLATS